MLAILEEYLYLRKISMERIDGAITGRKRQLAIDRFCTPSNNILVMLLSTKAGIYENYNLNSLYVYIYLL